MKIAFGCDHAGFPVKKEMIGFLEANGHTVADHGCSGAGSCDYPDFAALVARAVARGDADRGILICGTGVGMSIAANKVPGIRAGVCWNDDTAKLIREHNDTNILCMGARFASPADLKRWTGLWLATPASTQPRHRGRVEKMMALEKDREQTERKRR